MTGASGYSRPDLAAPTSELTRVEAKAFKAACPGLRVAAGSVGAPRDETFGPVLGAWEAWATDAEVRHVGSSGGVLSALASWLLESGRSTKGVAAGAGESPATTQVYQIQRGHDPLATAGSRYAPCAVLDSLENDTDLVIAKPCEASALRAWNERTGAQTPVILSFFCAGTPSQQATDGLAKELGFEPKRLAKLWYRGRGWPGRFTAIDHDGSEASMSYEESWGGKLGPHVQWRCRICVDGVGESADISAGDFWRADDRGYPDFSEGDGISVLLARTERGLALIQDAIAEGVIQARPTELQQLHPMQPYQVERRRYLVGRLIGTLLFKGAVPKYRGFGILASAIRRPRRTWHEFRGTVRRLRALRRRQAEDAKVMSK